MLDQVGGLVYDEVPNRQAAQDLAWALNRGAVTNEDALRLVTERDGKQPQWTEWVTSA